MRNILDDAAQRRNAGARTVQTLAADADAERAEDRNGHFRR
jgi:hypothetical protein